MRPVPQGRGMMQIKSKNAAYDNLERGDAARKKLIEAGIKIFSEVGYDGASTRRLATAAGVNVAAIPYYFNSKKGYYLAVIEYIIEHYQKNFGGGLAKIKRALQDKKTTRADFRKLLDDYMLTLVHFVLQEGKETSRISHIYIREQLDPTSAFDHLYEGFVRDMRETMAALVKCVVGVNVTASEAKMITQALLGQVWSFKLSRETILHNMGWENYGEKGMADIERIVMFNLDAIVQAYQEKGPTT